MVLALLGIGIGLVGAALAGKSLSSLLYGISALDAATLSAASAFLLIIALAASAIPALRAARIEPITALRTE
jgi:ABC-type antimicrobial peptide transport system permease subunit